MRRTTLELLLTSGVLLAGSAIAGRAAADDVLVLRSGVGGAVHDSILDGFPSLAPMDGVGDFGGNALGIALQPGVTEERAIVEFPLASLGALAEGGIDEAVLTFNIDDVLSTFGPGTGFDGTACDSVAVHPFAGDGVVTVADFARTGVVPLATIDTGGTITDATLSKTGPLAFDVDVTAALLAALDNGHAFLGFVFETDDAQTGTSIDDLGPGSAGPPGVGGASLPFLTITPAAPPTTTSSSTTSTSMEPLSECGDASGDGTITAGDALFILRSAVGGSPCPIAVCDADGNGKLSAGDALRVLKAAVGAAIDLVCKD
jgi:hypothetical protein